VVVACILVVFIFLDFGHFWGLVKGFFSVLSPILIGAILTYVFSPIVSFFERRVYYKLDREKKYRLKRVLSVVSMFVLVIAVLILVVINLIPSVLRGYQDITEMSEVYLDALKDWFYGLSFGEGHTLNGYLDTFVGYVVEVLDGIYSSFGKFSPDITSLATSIVGILSDVVLGIILSIYFLFSKEKIVAQFKKTVRAFLSHRKYRALGRSMTVTNEKFGGFLKGQLADAIILGAISYICLLVFGVPYYPLVSVLVGILSVIPVFGLLLGTIVGAIIILLTNPLGALTFIVYMAFLSLINRSMIKPRVIKIRVDASSVFMLAAILITTGLVGFWGLILGVPLFAVLYAFVHSLINKSLERREISTAPIEYYATQAGRELYLEGRDKEKKSSTKRIRESGELFSSTDHDQDDENSLFASTKKDGKSFSETEFPQ
jgi:predicted PurR-regulated permease PerM